MNSMRMLEPVAFVQTYFVKLNGSQKHYLHKILFKNETRLKRNAFTRKYCVSVHLLLETPRINDEPSQMPLTVPLAFGMYR